ncbi:unnamed protein product [Schistosoma margrebowiei]|uniref:Small acidic protein n=1 Tax=Schistosoma margrebowiei TaxID=48269 RepID=A0A183LKY9_9TREM|nr:unnamed protein product [Schistosoma margrebowiei]
MENDGQGDFKLTDVRSPNDWEHADLGSKDRNIKFLKLMGGNPVRDHKGKLVIGENIDNVHGQNKDTSVINEELENQYLQGLEKSMQPNCHHGLGSHTKSTVRLGPQTLSCCFQSYRSSIDLPGMVEPTGRYVPANIARLGHHDRQAPPRRQGSSFGRD